MSNSKEIEELRRENEQLRRHLKEKQQQLDEWYRIMQGFELRPYPTKEEWDAGLKRIADFINDFDKDKT